MKMHYRLIVEWWDADAQKARRVCNRVFKTHRGARRCEAKYRASWRADEYRTQILPLGYMPGNKTPEPLAEVL